MEGQMECSSFTPADREVVYPPKSHCRETSWRTCACPSFQWATSSPPSASSGSSHLTRKSMRAYLDEPFLTLNWFLEKLGSHPLRCFHDWAPFESIWTPLLLSQDCSAQPNSFHKNFDWMFKIETVVSLGTSCGWRVGRSVPIAQGPSSLWV